MKTAWVQRIQRRYKLIKADTEFNNLTRTRAETLLRKLIDPHTKGVFRDNTWLPIQNIIKSLEAAGIFVASEHTEYKAGKDGPSGKEWYWKIPFGEKGGWHFRIVASFGPSKIGETDAYDLVYTLSWDGRMTK